MKKGTLYLIPTPLGEGVLEASIPAGLVVTIRNIRHFVVEDLRTTRRFLKKVDKNTDIDSLRFYELNEHSRDEETAILLKPLLEGHDMGLMSEAGTPCVADPGASLVTLAHAAGIRVAPLVGPSSITLALMASGFNGQNFTFHGYLPVDRKARQQALRRLEQEAMQNDQTQIFIETPYRNMKMLESIIDTLRPSTLLCIAANLTGTEEFIRTLSVGEWKKEIPGIHKQPAVFLIYT